jgi:ribonuclease BN (tRNA processing enzyme)
MHITLIGTGTGVPSRRRNPPCILIKLGDKHAIFDSGPGTLRSLLQFGIDCLNLDFIFYTHLHLDHISEFSAILFAAKIPPAIRSKSLAVYGPRGLKDYYRKICNLYSYTIYTDTYKITLEEIENKNINIAGFEIYTKTLEHHDGGMGYRIVTPEGSVVVYSGDTDYCKEIIGLSKNANLLMLECSFPDDMKMKGHLSPITAGKIAQEANAKKLVLIHMYPICDEKDLLSTCRKEFSGEVILGEDLMQFEIV